MSGTDPFPDDDTPDAFEEEAGAAESLFGEYYAECVGCDDYRYVNDLRLCRDCSGKLERDLIRERDWAYCVSAYGMNDAQREDLRRRVVKKFGKDLELIAPLRKAEPKRKRRKRRRRK